MTFKTIENRASVPVVADAGYFAFATIRGFCSSNQRLTFYSEAHHSAVWWFELRKRGDEKKSAHTNNIIMIRCYPKISQTGKAVMNFETVRSRTSVSVTTNTTHTGCFKCTNKSLFLLTQSAINISSRSTSFDNAAIRTRKTG